jgi:hypothetical protein
MIEGRALDCPELERTYLLADGELRADDAARAREHLATCETCQTELADLVQLDMAVASAPPSETRPDAGRVISLAWYRRRGVRLASAVVAAAAAVMLYVATRPRGETPPGAQLALAPKRVVEARLSWGPTMPHRPYDVPRDGAVREQIALDVLAAIERSGDVHGVGALALLDGDRRRAASSLDKAGDGADVLADRAALALIEGTPERAIILADAARAKQPGHPAATWNRALALRDLGLTRAAAAGFREVAAKAEPGWADEAKARAIALDRETDARRDRAYRINAAMQTLVAGGTGLEPGDVQAVPGLSRLVLYDALRAAPTAERIAALKPLFEALGPDAEATRARSVARPALAATYAAIIAGDPPTGEARTRYLDALRAAGADELLIGALVRLAPDGRTVARAELPLFAKLAAASPDPWFRLLGLEQQAAVALAENDLVGAEAILLRARSQCKAPDAPAYRCIKVDTVLADVYRNWQRVAEARAVVDDAWARARRDNEWFLEINLLPAFINVAIIADDANGSGVPLVMAYAEEQRLRQPENCELAVWSRIATALALVNQLRVPDAKRELAAAPVCDIPLEAYAQTQHLFVRAHVVRETGTVDELRVLRVDIARLRDDPATPATVRIMLDHIEGRALIDRDPAAAELLLRRAIAAAKLAPPHDASARKAFGWSYAVLAIAAARRGDGEAALGWLAEEQGVSVPESCVLGLALDDQRRIAVARDAAGKVSVHYDETRTSPAIDPATVVPRAIAGVLAGCAVVDVIARSPLHGTPRLLGDAIAWRYRAARTAPLGPTSDRELVVADVEPPAALGLPRLAPWVGARGDRITGPSATPARILAAIGQAGVVTIHAHGVVDLGRDASLALSPDADGRYALTAADVRGARFSTSPLVILAACRASQAAPVLHEPWSLPVAFVQAGARAVIASASPIPDGDAGAFFDDLRARVSAGAPVAVALREARMHWLAQGRGDWVRDVIVFE